MNKNIHQQTLSIVFNIDLEKLHQAKVKIGAISQDTDLKESLYMSLMQLDMDMDNLIKNYFADYGSDILIGDIENE